MSALSQLHMDIAWQLQRIANQLPKGYMLTLVAREPKNDNAGIVLSEDDLDKAIEEINRLKNRTPMA